jgi:hypothetical protein
VLIKKKVVWYDTKKPPISGARPAAVMRREPEPLCGMLAEVIGQRALSGALGILGVPQKAPRVPEAIVCGVIHHVKNA